MKARNSQVLVEAANRLATVAGLAHRGCVPPAIHAFMIETPILAVLRANYGGSNTVAIFRFIASWAGRKLWESTFAIRHPLLARDIKAEIDKDFEERP